MLLGFKKKINKNILDTQKEMRKKSKHVTKKTNKIQRKIVKENKNKVAIRPTHINKMQRVIPFQ